MYQAIIQALQQAIAALANTRAPLAANDPNGAALDIKIASLNADLTAVSTAQAQQALNTLQQGDVANYLTAKTNALNQATQTANNVANALNIASTIVSIAASIAGAVLAL